MDDRNGENEFLFSWTLDRLGKENQSENWVKKLDIDMRTQQQRQARSNRIGFFSNKWKMRWSKENLIPRSLANETK